MVGRGVVVVDGCGALRRAVSRGVRRVDWRAVVVR